MLAERPICQPHPGLGKEWGKDACWINSSERRRGGGGPGACSPGPAEEWEGRMVMLAWDAQGQAGTGLSGCFLLGELLGDGGYNRQQLVKSRGQLQVN